MIADIAAMFVYVAVIIAPTIMLYIYYKKENKR